MRVGTGSDKSFHLFQLGNDLPMPPSRQWVSVGGTKNNWIRSWVSPSPSNGWYCNVYGVPLTTKIPWFILFWFDDEVIIIKVSLSGSYDVD